MDAAPEPALDLRKVPFLNDKTLREAIRRMSRRYFREEAQAEDVFQTTYLVAMELLVSGSKVVPGKEAGWLRLVCLNRARAEFRRTREGELPVDPADLPDLPAEDIQKVHEEQERIEAQLRAYERLKKERPLLAAYLRVGDSRKDESEPKDPATRKGKQRAREFFSTGIIAAVPALAVAFFMHTRKPPMIPQPRLAWDDTTLAAASRELAVRSCAAHQWTPCLDHLQDAKHLAPSAFGPAETSAAAGAIAALRSDALHACEKQQWKECADGLDDAAKYDPKGDEDPLVRLARSEAATHVPGRSRAPQPLPDAKGPF